MTPKKVNGKLPLFSGNGSRVIPIYVLKYKPTHRKYACDANMVPATHKNQVSIEKIKDGAWSKRGRPFAEEFQLSNFAKKSKKPGIFKVPIHICVGISHCYTCISILQKRK